mmetsp:Transcript_32153/g.86110  ORF Transcript_32153/g.86110 Transcript_32153/m.86110 type:complete len:96 (+) Transcript_32153:307-594(+)
MPRERVHTVWLRSLLQREGKGRNLLVVGAQEIEALVCSHELILQGWSHVFGEYCEVAERIHDRLREAQTVRAHVQVANEASEMSRASEKRAPLPN